MILEPLQQPDDFCAVFYRRGEVFHLVLLVRVAEQDNPRQLSESFSEDLVRSVACLVLGVGFLREL